MYSQNNNAAKRNNNLTVNSLNIKNSIQLISVCSVYLLSSCYRCCYILTSYIVVIRTTARIFVLFPATIIEASLRALEVQLVEVYLLCISVIFWIKLNGVVTNPTQLRLTNKITTDLAYMNNEKPITT